MISSQASHNKLKSLCYPAGVPFDSLHIPDLFKETYLEGLYVDVTTQKSPHSMTIVDIGANIGIVTQYLEPFAKQLYAIEPASEHYVALVENIKRNDWKHVKPFNLAIADHDGEMDLHLCEKNRTAHSLVNPYPNSKSEKIKTQTIATFLKENEIESVDFMKMDVEGAEEIILPSDGFSSVADKIKSIEIEFHYANFPNLVNCMTKYGFTAKRYDSSLVVYLFFR